MEVRDEETISLKTILVNYLLHWKLILGVGTFAVILAVLYLLLYPKTYDTMARVQIQDENSSLSAGSMALGEAAGIMKSFGLGGLQGGSIVIDDEIATFTSNSLLSGMAYRLGLYAEYTAPFSFYRLYKDKPLTVTVDSADIYNLEYEVEFKVKSSANKIDIKAYIEADDDRKESFHFTSLPAVVKMKEGTFVFDYTDSGRSKPDFKLNVLVRTLPSMSDEYFDAFLIEEVSKTSNVIEFTVSDYEKKRAKDMFNTLIAIYNERSKRYRDVLAQRSQEFLDTRIDDLVGELVEVERKMEEYKTKNRMTIVEADVQYYVEYMKDLQGKMIDAESQSYLIQLMDAFVNDTTNRYKVIPSLVTSGQESETSPFALYNQAILERERLIQNSGKDNPQIPAINVQIEKLREGVCQMIDNMSKSAQMVIADLKAKEKGLFDRMGEVPMQERVYVDYKRQQEILQGIYLILLQKREEVVLSVAQAKEKAKVIDPAFNLPRPIAPRKLYAAIGIVFFTLLVTVGWIYGKKQYTELMEEFQKARK